MIEAPATPAGISMTGDAPDSLERIIWQSPGLASELCLLSAEIIRAQVANGGVYRIDAERWRRIADALGVVSFKVRNVSIVPYSGEMVVWGYGPKEGDRLISALRDVARG